MLMVVLADGNEKMEMLIGNRKISRANAPLVIAEIGINHGGNLNVAKNMVLEAFKAGCECIKHQTHFVDDEMTSEAKEIYPPNADISIWDVMNNSSLSPSDERDLKLFTEDLGMIWISTPFSRVAVDFLEELNVPAYKIGSGEVDNLPLIRHIASKGKPVIMSTGMQTIKTLKKSVQILENAGIDFALLECTNLYPSPPENVSLGGIIELRNAFPNAIIGYSDHSIGPTMAVASVALGASIVERHFTDSRYRVGPDISCSMDPSELKFLLERSKEVHRALLNPKKRTEKEEDVYRFARSSVVADKDLPANHIICEADIWARRPGTGEIPGFEFDDVIGKVLKKKVLKNTQLKWSDFDV
jgi:sialic acid synthase SpsE